MLGETGFSMAAAALETTAFWRWCQEGALPASACRLLEQCLHLSCLSGLLRVVPASGLELEPESVWILGRSDQGLLSIVVRNARGADVQRLHEDAELALGQAARYTAKLAVVLVQSCSGDEATEGYRSFARDMGKGDAPVAHDSVQAVWHAGAGKMLAHGWLEPRSF